MKKPFTRQRTTSGAKDQSGLFKKLRCAAEQTGIDLPQRSMNYGKRNGGTKIKLASMVKAGFRALRVWRADRMLWPAGLDE
jgi:hypothetical protein